MTLDGLARTASTASSRGTRNTRVGSVIEADLFGYHEWKVIELRDESNSLFAATDADGTPIPLGGTLVCRGVR
jgi:hypothetical protein